MLTANHRQESLSRAYIQAVAGRCGLNCAFREYDYGIDVTVHEITRRRNRYIESGFNLDIQAKSTINAIFDDKFVKYDMEIKTYDDLRDSQVGTPRILVLLALPEKEDEWALFSEDQLILKRCAYWLSLKGWPATKNETSVRVSIPRTNRFDVESLARIMEYRRQGEDL